MEYRLLGGSGLKVPAVGFGTATFGGGNEFFKAWGETNVLFGMANWIRISSASKPAMTRKISAYTMYMIPIFL